MRILIADTNGDLAREIETGFGNAGANECLSVKSHKSAKSQISGGNLDCFVLNPVLRRDDESHDTDINVGLELFRDVIRVAPLTPILLVTDAPLSIQFIDALLAGAQMSQFGYFSPPLRSVSIHQSADIDGVIAKIQECCTATDSLSDIELSTGTNFIPLSHSLKKVLRQFSERFGGNHCRIRLLAGGLSGSSVYELKVEDDAGSQRVLAVGKIDRLGAVIDEIDKYEREVTRLPHDAYAPMVGRILNGSSDNAGVFYRLLDQDNRTLFDVVENNDRDASTVVQRLQNQLATWTNNFRMEMMTVGDVRRYMLDDDTVADLVTTYDLDWVNRYEDVSVNIPLTTVHGDLHGANILVSDACHPKLIDFGDVGTKPCMYDPITLEFSIFTHPVFSGKTQWLPDLEQSEWRDLDPYIADSPYRHFISACRNWSCARAGDSAVYSAAYGYLMRQLKYKDTDKQLILSLLNSIRKSAFP